MDKLLGNIHSIETFGTVDGPGVRFVVFFQGCPMRCKYCHNPDTWNFDTNIKLSVDEILNKFDSVKEFLKNGGITVSGGEPLAQIDFLTELFKQSKQKNIHTAVDTSGILFDYSNINKFNDLIKYTDLVILDIKHINDAEHKKLTQHSNKAVLDFARFLSDNNISMWIRHVLVPKITDKEIYLQELGRFMSELKSIKRFEILPYHNMAIEKYRKLNLSYPLTDVLPPGKNEVIKAKNIIMNFYNMKIHKTK